MRVHVVRESEIKVSGRVLQIRSLFDVQPGMGQRVEWDVDVPLEERPWGVGLIVGPSGSGKSTVAREMFGARVVERFDWPSDRSIIDGFPAVLPTDQVAGLLTSVGFGSVPDWMRPFHVLSTGQQFRATLARSLAEGEGLVCVDEFTSVVDRQVGQICAHAVSKAARRMGRQFVAVTCHDDVEAWLDPDWVLDFQSGAPEFRWRSVQGRPRIELEIRRVHQDAWNFFKKHHYLTGDLPATTVAYCAFVANVPIAYIGVCGDFSGRKNNGWRTVRTVVVPEWQGVGIGSALRHWVAACWAGAGIPMCSKMAHDGVIKMLAQSPLWVCERAKAVNQGGAGRNNGNTKTWVAGKGRERPTATFRYIGPADPLGPLDWQRSPR